MISLAPCRISIFRDRLRCNKALINALAIRRGPPIEIVKLSSLLKRNHTPIVSDVFCGFISDFLVLLF